MAKTIQAQQVMPWLLTAAAGYAVVKVLDKFFGKSAHDKGLEETDKTVKNEIKNEQNKGTRASYSDAQFKTLADTLEDAMAGPGTDENKIYQAMVMMKNNLDILKLVDAFGIRNYWITSRLLGTNKNLGQWLRSDLSPDEIYQANLLLANNGVHYQF